MNALGTRPGLPLQDVVLAGNPFCFSEEVAVSCSACSPVGAPAAPVGSLSLLRQGWEDAALSGMALLFALQFEAFYLG